MTTDTALVHRAASGDPDAFAVLYDESFRCVYARAARRTGDRAAAEQLTEQILARVFQSLDDYTGSVPFAAWLLAVAKRSEPLGPREPRRAAPRAPFASGTPR